MTTTSDEQAPKRRKLMPEESREHYKKARDEMREAIANLLPEGFLEHRRSAKREMLLAWRSLIDAAIKRMDENA